MRLLRFLWSEMSKHFPRSTPKIWNTSRRGLQLDSLMFPCHAHGLLAEMATEDALKRRRHAVLLGACSQVAGLVPALWLTDHPCWELAAPTPTLRGLVKSWLGGWNISIVCFSGMPSSCSELASCLPTPPACAWSCSAPQASADHSHRLAGVAWGQQMVTSQISVTSSLTFGNTFVSCYF